MTYYTTWARYAYDVEKGAEKLGDEKVIKNVKFETQMVIGYDAATNTILSTYRGSSNIMNWIENFDFIKTEFTAAGCSDCTVHQGFNAAYNSLKDDVHAQIAKL